MKSSPCSNINLHRKLIKGKFEDISSRVVDFKAEEPKVKVVEVKDEAVKAEEVNAIEVKEEA